MKRITDILIFLALGIIFFSCNELDKYSEIPEIEFSGYTVDYEYANGEILKKNVTIQFSILDGDGDVGLLPEDTVAPYKDSLASNFFATIFVRKNHKWVSGDQLNYLPIRYRMPYMGEGTTSLLKADVFIDFSYAAKLFPYDSIKYNFYILDRALHKSNIDSTTIIVFQEN